MLINRCSTGSLLQPLLASLFLCVSFWQSDSVAETVKFAGRDFTVDKLTALPGDQVRVEIGQHVFLVDLQSLGQRVFGLYALNPTLLAENSIDLSYGKFVREVAEGAARAEAQSAILQIIASPSLSINTKRGFIEGVTGSVLGRDLVVEALILLAKEGAAQRHACALFPSFDPSIVAELKRSNSADLNWIVQVCAKELLNQAQAAFFSEDYTAAKTALGFISYFFRGASDLAQAAQSSLDRFNAVQALIKHGSADDFEAGLREGSFDPLFRDYYVRFQSKLIVQFSERSLLEDKPTAALQALSILNFSERTDLHHDLVFRAFNRLQIKDGVILLRTPISQMLVAYAAKDKRLEERYVDFLQASIEQSLQSERLEQGVKFLALLKDVRRDPDYRNDTLRGHIAEGFVDVNRQDQAGLILAEVRTNIPWIIRFRLLLKLDSYVLLMVLLALVVILRWLIMFGIKVRHFYLSVNQQEHSWGRSPFGANRRQASLDEDRARAEASTNLKGRAHKGLDEYADGLALLNLPPSATLHDIKNAYRALVKSLHPDLNPHASREDTQRFIELTQAYERLLVLCEERSGKGEA